MEGRHLLEALELVLERELFLQLLQLMRLLQTLILLPKIQSQR